MSPLWIQAKQDSSRRLGLIDARFQNRSATSEMLLLGGVVPGVSQIDEVKINPGDVCPAQVGASQVGLPDFFGLLAIRPTPEGSQPLAGG